MFCCSHKKQNPYNSTACVVDGKLILSFPNARTPIVWQMDMSDVKASALEVREDKKTKSHILILKTPKGEETDIAPFEQKEQAVDGLIAVTQALQTAHGQIRSGEHDACCPHHAHGNKRGHKRGIGKWATLALILLGLFFLIGFLRNAQNNDNNYVNSDITSSSSGQNSTGAQSSGVPMSADEFLRNR